jgi:hypothetical protein
MYCGESLSHDGTLIDDIETTVCLSLIPEKGF